MDDTPVEQVVDDTAVNVTPVEAVLDDTVVDDTPVEEVVNDTTSTDDILWNPGDADPAFSDDTADDEPDDVEQSPTAEDDDSDAEPDDCQQNVPPVVHHHHDHLFGSDGGNGIFAHWGDDILFGHGLDIVFVPSLVLNLFPPFGWWRA